MTNNSDLIVKLEKVTKSYDTENSVYALNEVDLEIQNGESVAIMGPSGSGKSTLLNLLCGIDEQSSGKVFLNGVETAKLNDDQRTRLRREKIGIIFQTFNLLPTLTALENVSLPLRLNGLRRREADQKSLEMLERVGLEKRISHRPDEMSGGERQRVAIARALIFNPLLVLADEPTGNLDSKTGADILELLDNLHQTFKTTIILVTHDELAASHCQRRITLRDGQIVADERRLKCAGKIFAEKV